MCGWWILGWLSIVGVSMSGIGQVNVPNMRANKRRLPYQILSIHCLGITYYTQGMTMVVDGYIYYEVTVPFVLLVLDCTAIHPSSPSLILLGLYRHRYIYGPNAPHFIHVIHGIQGTIFKTSPLNNPEGEYCIADQ